MAEPTRTRCKDDEALLAVLQQHIEKTSTIIYRDRLNSSLDASKLLEHKAMLLALRAGPCPTGSVVQSVAEAAFMKLATEKEEEWHLGAEKPSWVKKMALRLRAMLRDIQQGIYKAKGRKHPKWLEDFIDSAGTTPSAATSAQPAVVQYTFGYDDDMHLAWRCPAGKDKKELCKHLSRPDGAGDQDDAVAVWGDGTTWKVPVVT
jgi:hypothetical protein